MFYPNSIENVCYTDMHLNDVKNEINTNFETYFHYYVESDGGNVLTHEQIEQLKSQFGQESVMPNKERDIATRLKHIMKESIDCFEKDRQAYMDLLDEETFEEYEDSPLLFKNALKIQCPIIKNTLMSKAKELGKYKREYSICNPNDLLIVCHNLSSFAYEYAEDFEEWDYDSLTTLEDLELTNLDTENYTVFGVIGGGIKSLLLQKLQPEYFVHRSKEAIWALWYLSSKKTFDCVEDSEFLMIDTEKSKTSQNYFYPYELFGYYSYHIYLRLKSEFEKYNVHLNDEYRYVIVGSFYNAIAHKHEEEIKFLSSSSEEKSISWA